MDAPRPGVIVSRMTWKVLSLSQRMYSLGINEAELRGQLANQVSRGKMAVKMECVCVVVTCYYGLKHNTKLRCTK